MVGVTWYEVLYLWTLQEMPPAVVAALILELGQWCKGRHRAKGRPQLASLLGPDGRVVKWVRVEPDGVLSEGSGPKQDDSDYPMGRQPPTQRIGRMHARLAAVLRRVGLLRHRLRWLFRGHRR